MKIKFINYNLKIFLFRLIKAESNFLGYFRKLGFMYRKIQVLLVFCLGVYDGLI